MVAAMEGNICQKQLSSCSNVAKLFEKNYVFLRKKYVWFLQKNIFLSKSLFFFQIKLCIQNKYLYPLSKKFNSVKKISLCKNIHSV